MPFGMPQGDIEVQREAFDGGRLNSIGTTEMSKSTPKLDSTTARCAFGYAAGSCFCVLLQHKKHASHPQLRPHASHFSKNPPLSPLREAASELLFRSNSEYTVNVSAGYPLHSS